MTSIRHPSVPVTWCANALSRLATAVAIASVPFTGALAADNDPAAEKQDAERVEVTGSRIKGVDMEGASPVITVDREDLEKRGYDNIADFLKDLPQTASAGTFNESGGVASGTRGQPAGSAGVSVRGLGSSSTLVLVNGRRVVLDSFTNGFDSFVDVNSIPMSAIERVEVLTDGASSVYGSDAIAGVINFILRKDIDGQELSVMAGDDTEKGDFGRYNLTYVTGFNTASSNTSIILDFYKRNALMNRDRDIDVTLLSSTRVTIDGRDYAEPWCGSNTSNGGARCQYDYVIQRAVQPDTENLGLTLNHRSALGAEREFFAEFMLQKNQGHAYEGAASFDLRVPGTYAHTPAWVHDINDNDGNPGQVRIRSRFADARIQSFDDQTWRALAGLRGMAGIVSVHVGDAADGLAFLDRLLAESDLPITQFYPTHINRNRRLFADGIGYAKRGGYIDFTTSTTPQLLASGEVKAARALREALDAGVPLAQITFSSDANASLPLFDEAGQFRGLGLGDIASLFEEVRAAVRDEAVDLASALAVISENPARILQLPDKGCLRAGADADVVLLDAQQLRVQGVIAGGRLLMMEGVLQTLPVFA